MRNLAAATRGVHHGGLGRAAIDNKGAAATGGGIGESKTDEVHVLIEPIAVAQRIGLRGGRALSENDDATRSGDWQHQSDVAP